MKCLALIMTVGGSSCDQYLAPTMNPGLEGTLISPPPFSISQSSRCWQPLYDRCGGGTYGRNINREFHAGVTAPKFVHVNSKIGSSCIVAFVCFFCHVNAVFHGIPVSSGVRECQSQTVRSDDTVILGHSSLFILRAIGNQCQDCRNNR